MSPREFVVIDVPQGQVMEAQSGLQMTRPRIYGALAGAPRGAVGAIVIHPTSNFLDHFLMEPLARAGVSLLGLNTRYAGNDSVLLMERAIQDLGAGMLFMRERFETVFLVGYSGGAALTAFYQAQAEKLTVTHTPGGEPVRLDPAAMPPADGIVLMGAHLGRARLLRDWLDASLIDEGDPYATDPALDIYDRRNGPPFAPEFMARVQAAQAARSDRITARVKRRLQALREDPVLPRDEPMLVYRTYADPRFVDLSHDANDRAPGGNRGDDPRVMNYGVNSLARYTSLSAWMSQWSMDSQADGPTNLALTSVPVLHLELTADGSVFPSAIREWSQAIRSGGRDGRESFHRIPKATHYFRGQPELVEQVAQLCAYWSARLAGAHHHP